MLVFKQLFTSFTACSSNADHEHSTALTYGPNKINSTVHFTPVECIQNALNNFVTA